eukprot:TRINITY_DN21865_c0_g2_i1.p1 TRINITY_DN21865_c0_g2~~TRINITY_DN21865_c0_g2_i1.p1  ORF type:complete len:664 (-),score=55.38 TRINITY_DN21865_c0_g2_i1:128-2119(-)
MKSLLSDTMRLSVCMSILFYSVLSSTNLRGVGTAEFTLVDKNATEAVRSLYRSLLAITFNDESLRSGPYQDVVSTMFGAQDTLSYGYEFPYIKGGVIEDPPKSDFYTASKHQLYPKVFGFDVGNIYNADGLNVDRLHRDDIARWVRKAHEMGGVITLSMHNDNPLTGRSSYDNVFGTVASILPGGSKHHEWMWKLSVITEFIESLAPIPIIFRPYHEQNHNWSWWGATSCTQQQYSQLFRMTVDYMLRRESWERNVLFATSPQDPKMVGSGNDWNLDEYFSRYPGHEYVDLLGVDGYELWKEDAVGVLSASLNQLIAYSSTTMRKVGHLKPVALTEVGAMYWWPQSPPAGEVPTYGPFHWWTGYLNKVFEATQYRLAFALVWRNKHQEWHCFVPVVVNERGDDICQFQNFQRFLETTQALGTGNKPLVQYLHYNGYTDTGPTSSTTEGPFVPVVTPSPTQSNGATRCCYSGDCANPGSCNPIGEWCSESLSNCGVCGGFLCGTASSPSPTSRPTSSPSSSLPRPSPTPSSLTSPTSSPTTSPSSSLPSPSPTPSSLTTAIKCCYGGTCTSADVCNSPDEWCSSSSDNCRVCGGMLCQAETERSMSPTAAPAAIPEPGQDSDVTSSTCCYSGTCGSSEVCNAPTEWCSASALNCERCGGFFCTA